MHVCEACDDSFPIDEASENSSKQAIMHQHQAIQREDSINWLHGQLLLESPEASHQPKKFQKKDSTSRKRMIEVTDAPTEKTRPAEILATRTGIDYAKIYPRASQPESQEEVALNQNKKQSFPNPDARRAARRGRTDNYY